MKVFLAKWLLSGGPSNSDEGIVGIYSNEQNATYAAKKFIEGIEDFEYYSFNIEEVEVDA